MQGSTVQWCTCARINRAMAYSYNQPCNGGVQSTVQWRRTRCARINRAVVYLCKGQPCSGGVRVVRGPTVQWRTLCAAVERVVSHSLCNVVQVLQGSPAQRRTRCERICRAIAHVLVRDSTVPLRIHSATINGATAYRLCMD